MALPTTGLITLEMVCKEFGKPLPYTMSQLYGAMPGVPTSGMISLMHFYGVANTFTLTISNSIASPAIHQLALNAGWNGTAPLLVIFACPMVNSIRLDSTKTFPGGLTLQINAGCFVGGVINSGTAIFTTVPVSINNMGTIAGGGGKGGTGNWTFARYSNDPTNVNGPPGAGGNGQGFANTSATSVTAAQLGFYGTTAYYSGDTVGAAPWASGGTGGNGGNWGIAGAVGQSNGDWGGNYSAGGVATPATAGAVAGLYIYGNSQVTWINKGTVMGNFS